jgi:hypothetical protein
VLRSIAANYLKLKANNRKPATSNQEQAIGNGPFSSIRSMRRTRHENASSARRHRAGRRAQRPQWPSTAHIRHKQPCGALLRIPQGSMQPELERRRRSLPAASVDTENTKIKNPRKLYVLCSISPLMAKKHAAKALREHEKQALRK